MSSEKFQGHFLQKLFESIDVDDLFDDEDDENSPTKDENGSSDEKDLNSDSEQESEYSDDEDQRPEKKVKQDYYLGRNKVTKWMKTPINRQPAKPAVCIPSVPECGSSAKTVLETWELFFPEEMLNVIVENTNKYISEISSHSSRERDARPIDVIELRALLGLLYMSGLLKSSRLNVNELWDQNGFGVERFWLTMSKHRFLFLMRSVHFAERNDDKKNPDQDKLAEIRHVMDLFVNRCQVMYNPSDIVTVGEMLISFRGACPFRQYVPSKAKRYGIKMFALVDTRIPYTKNLEVDCGQESEGSYRIGVPDAQKIFERLIAPLSGTFRIAVCDKRFTSFDLMQTLLNNHQLTFVGGVRKTKKELPREFVNTKSRQIHSSIFGYREDTTLVSYVPEKGKSIIVASTLNDTNTIQSKPRRNEIPDLITFYDSTKVGVEVVEQYCSTYDASRFTKRWQMVIFFSLLNIGAINSYLIYLQNNSSEELFRRTYLKELAIGLTQEHLKRRAMQKNVSPEVRQRRKQVAGIVDDEPKGDTLNPNVRKRCFLCKNRSKTRFFCRYCGKFICLKHSQFVCENCV